MFKLKPAQLIFALLTSIIFIVMTFFTIEATRIPGGYNTVLVAAESAEPKVVSISREIVTYAFTFQQWMAGSAPKSEVLSAEVTLNKDLSNYNQLTGISVLSLLSPSELQTFTLETPIFKNAPQGFLPKQMQTATQAALNPSLKNIINLTANLSLSYQDKILAEIQSAVLARHKVLIRSDITLLLFLLMLSIFIFWVGFTFLERYKSIQRFIRTQMNDLETSKDELERTRIAVTELRILDNEKNEFTANLAKFAVMLQGHRELMTVSKTVLSELAPLVHVEHGVFYILNESADGKPRLKILSSYTSRDRNNIPRELMLGEELIEQCAIKKKRILITAESSDYIQINSGLGEALPTNIIVLPMIFEGVLKGVFGLASFTPFSPTQQDFLDQVADSVGTVINTIEINMRTEELLNQSQNLADELKSQHTELLEANQELEEKTQLLAEQKHEVEEIKSAVEEKASQLELISKYKSEFLSNMSHELRTPLNSLLVLAELLSDNRKSHLDSEEVKYAKLIHVSGNDLLSMINEILDLSKIESGTVVVDSVPVPIVVIRDNIENTFSHFAKDRGLGLEIACADDLPSVILTDEVRLLQVMKNLLANAIKFTENGHISVRIDRALAGWSEESESLNSAEEVIAFVVEDTGIGISADKQQIIFEAFQQGEGKTARKYGGTGLGLSISREIAHLLGGELRLVRSAPEHGSTFALYLPHNGMKIEGSSKTNLANAHRAGVVPQLQQSTNQLTGKKVLLVDDDPRNIVALTAALEQRGLIVIPADNGYAAMELLKDISEIDLMLIDIMMPEIDGYETMREIRKMPKFEKSPIIALTAKAMVGDREKCIEAGASDYLSKPVNVEQLALLMQVWLSK